MKSFEENEWGEKCQFCWQYVPTRRSGFFTDHFLLAFVKIQYQTRVIVFVCIYFVYLPDYVLEIYYKYSFITATWVVWENLAARSLWTQLYRARKGALNSKGNWSSIDGKHKPQTPIARNFSWTPWWCLLGIKDMNSVWNTWFTAFLWILFKVRNHYLDLQSLKIHLLPFLYSAHQIKHGKTQHGKA